MEIKKVFISQPMKDLPDEEIRRIRNATEKLVTDENPQYEIEFIDSYFDDYTFIDGVKNKPLHYLADSIKLLSTADIAVFVNDWYMSRGCKIEHDCAVQYGIQTVEVKVV